ncbi:lytic transglycosylase domain-containing protein [Pseudomonas sp. Q1-7]|uniref:lytic transglycosylase domain-containing protein n=1 Tax=Pseudomonas sp. Q1-7 TaxID=3020843 RepID=UPI002301BD34|nr:lytic transglycosylase domain-containing protein [Pseudomonas sp. Q1-7]
MALATSAFLALAAQCAPAVAPATLLRLASHESSLNPYAIAVVGQALPRQPQSLDEALVIANQLANEGASFSVGLGQINSQHFEADDPQELTSLFEPCRNLQLTEFHLQDCYSRALSVTPNPQAALRKALSCYYSGNFTRGFKPEAAFGNTSYVERVLAQVDGPFVPAPDDSAPPSPALTAPPPAPPQPSYERWDVLHQFPRFNAAPPPAQVQPQPQEETPANVQATDRFRM